MEELKRDLGRLRDGKLAQTRDIRSRVATHHSEAHAAIKQLIAALDNQKAALHTHIDQTEKMFSDLMDLLHGQFSQIEARLAALEKRPPAA